MSGAGIGDAGALDTPVTFLRSTIVKDARSGATKSEDWTAAFNVWAARRGVVGSETNSSGQVVATADEEFRIRWRDDVDAKLRIQSDGVVYDIQSVLPAGQRREALVIRARRRTD